MNKELKDSLNDVIVDSKLQLGVDNLDVSLEDIQKLYKSLPISVIKTGEEWGWNDTVFRDSVCEFYMEEYHD